MSYRCDRCGSKKHQSVYDLPDGHGSWTFGKQCKVCGYWWTDDKRITMPLPIQARIIMNIRVVCRNCLRLARRVREKVRCSK